MYLTLTLKQSCENQFPRRAGPVNLHLVNTMLVDADDLVLQGTRASVFSRHGID